jgi:hypothetical protein
LITALTYGSGWINTYWGGAFCAFGGALFFGALCRWLRSPSWAFGLIAGVGWSIVWFIRPFESLILFALALSYFTWVIQRGAESPKRLAGTIALFLSIQILAGGLTAIHNRAVTGSYLTLPYQLSQQVYGVPQGFVVQPIVVAPDFRFEEASKVYRWQLEVRQRAEREPLRRLSLALYCGWWFFLTPWYTIPLVPLLRRALDRRVLLALGTIGCALSATVLYPFLYAHYLAAYTCVFAYLIASGMAELSRFSFRGYRLGGLVVLLLMVGGAISGLQALVPLRTILRNSTVVRGGQDRAQIAKYLRNSGGRHLVMIRYGTPHDFHDEWVFNAGDLDASPIVWGRWLGAETASEPARYFRDRHKWMAEVDDKLVRLWRCDSKFQVITERPDLALHRPVPTWK